MNYTSVDLRNIYDTSYKQVLQNAGYTDDEIKENNYITSFEHFVHQFYNMALFATSQNKSEFFVSPVSKEGNEHIYDYLAFNVHYDSGIFPVTFTIKKIGKGEFTHD